MNYVFNMLFTEISIRLYSSAMMPMTSFRLFSTNINYYCISVSNSVFTRRVHRTAEYSEFLITRVYNILSNLLDFINLYCARASCIDIATRTLSTNTTNSPVVEDHSLRIATLIDWFIFFIVQISNRRVFNRTICLLVIHDFILIEYYGIPYYSDKTQFLYTQNNLTVRTYNKRNCISGTVFLLPYELKLSVFVVVRHYMFFLLIFKIFKNKSTVTIRGAVIK